MMYYGIAGKQSGFLKRKSKMNENQIADIWLLFKEYVDKKTVAVAAERYIELLIDNGVSDKLLEEVIGHDDYLDSAIEYYLEVDSDDTDDSYESDNWDFDEDDD